MHNIRSLQGLFLLTLLVALPALGQKHQKNSCSQSTYENRNFIDYGPLKVQDVRGVAWEPGGAHIVGACIAIFSEENHTLIAAVETSKAGTFLLSGIPPGRYRLVVKASPLCPANAQLIVVKHQWRKRILHVHMKVGGIDECSFIEVAGLNQLDGGKHFE